jgi:P27 family predicted phage terminase small subunit
LRGNPGKRPLRPEPEPDRGSQCPEPPEFLSSDAVTEWRKVAPELHRSRMLTAFDVMPLAAYCAAFSRWKAAEEELAREAAQDPRKALTVTDAKGVMRPNPLLRLSRAAAAEMVKIAGQFGMSPAARSRIAAGIAGQPQPSKFDGLI